MLREKIRITLEHHAGGAADASVVAEAVTSTWTQMADLLTPVIGTRGVNVILRRSLHLMRIECPWLLTSEEHGDSAALLACLKARLAGRNPGDALRAGHGLLINFTELLATLIGESLTERLLGPVWASPDPFSENEVEP